MGNNTRNNNYRMKIHPCIMGVIMRMQPFAEPNCYAIIYMVLAEVMGGLIIGAMRFESLTVHLPLFSFGKPKERTE
jgi:hypothetical protein